MGKIMMWTMVEKNCENIKSVLENVIFKRRRRSW